MLRKSILAAFVCSAGAFAQAPSVSAVVNAFSFDPQICPGAVVQVFGKNFGSSAAAVTVMVGGKPGAVTFASPTVFIMEIPFEASAGPTTLTVTVGGAASDPFNITLAAYAPAFNTVAGGGVGPAVVQTPGGVLVTSAAPASPGDTLVTFAVGLGPTNPPTPTGPAKAANQTAILPTLTIGGVPATVLYAGIVNGSDGLYQINFKVPPGLQGSQLMVITIGGVSSKFGVLLPLFGITEIVNNASQTSNSTAAAGSFVTIKANGLGLTDQLTGFPATKFQGVQVTFNGIAAPLYHLIANAPAGSTPNQKAAFQQQIDLLIPNELPTTGTVSVQLTTPTMLNPNYPLIMAPAVPGIYRIPGSSNVIAQFNNTVWLAMPASMAKALNLPGNCSNSNINPLSYCGQPATVGDYLVLYATGLGITTPNGDPNGTPLATGQFPPADGSVLYQTPTKPELTIGGIPVNVIYSGLPPGIAGEYQIVFQIPSGLTANDDTPVVLFMGNFGDTATISIQPR